MKNVFTIVCLIGIAASGCRSSEKEFDASGAFEAIETIVSAEVAGSLVQYKVQEGQHVTTGTLLGYVDSTQLHLQKQQLEMQMEAILSQRPDAAAQLAALDAQMDAAIRERKRLQGLVADSAVPQKQLDDVNTQVEVLTRQKDALRSTLSVTTQSISRQTEPIKVQIDLVNDRLAKCRLTAPVDGTILANYTHEHELAAPGKPLYKIANLDELTLRAYVTADQLSSVKINQQVRVFIDEEDGYGELPGTVSWVSDKAEFTPKTIQTKAERANLVYAIKVRVKNTDGALKLGMYGEVKFK